jgi:hypothetical protein
MVSHASEATVRSNPSSDEATRKRDCVDHTHIHQSISAHKLAGSGGRVVIASTRQSSLQVIFRLNPVLRFAEIAVAIVLEKIGFESCHAVGQHVVDI